LTGGRLKRDRQYLDPGDPFCLTYGDGVADVDVTALIAFHKTERRPATLTAVVPPGRYGVLDLEGSRVVRFIENRSAIPATLTAASSSSIQVFWI
jgi:glucose-1-phosphate cytidylyltransferase